MRKESSESRIRRARYRTYLKRHYADLRELQARGAYLPDLDHFLKELQALQPCLKCETPKLAANG
jgi:hypothetical protein